MVFFILAGTFASLGKNAGTMAWRCTNLLFSSVTRRLFASTVGQREPLLARTQQPAADFNCLWKHARPRICLINLERRSGGLAVRQRYRSQKKKRKGRDNENSACTHTNTHRQTGTLRPAAALIGSELLIGACQRRDGADRHCRTGGGKG